MLTLLSGSSTVGVPSETIDVLGLPADATPVYNPTVTPIFGGSPGTLIVTTGPSSLGDFPLAITATDPVSGGVHSGDAILHIYDFTVTVTPSGQTVLRGADPAVYYLDLTLVPLSSQIGIPGELVSISGLPSGTPPPVLSAPTITPTSAGCSPPLCPTLTVSTQGPPTGPLGDSTFTVTGTDPANGGSRSGSAELHIFDFVAAMTPSVSLFQGETVTVKVSLPLDLGSTTVGLPSVSLTLTGLPSGVTAVGFPSALIAGGGQSFLLETSSVGTYISCPQVSSHGGQNLQRDDLAHCILSGFDLKGDNLQYANLSGANLSNADLSGANLQGANLSSANTSGTDFQGDNLQGADLSAAGAVGTFTLTVTGTVDGSSRSGQSTLTVYGDQLSGDDLQGANLQRADLAGDLATGANFQGDNLQYANLAGAVLTGANFQGDNLQYANLAGAFLSGANFQGDNLKNAEMTGATLTGLGPLTSQQTNFNGANLQDAVLTGAVCGTPNYITANGANTKGLVGVPSSCNPPLDPPLSPSISGGGVAYARMLLAPSALIQLVLVLELLAGTLLGWMVVAELNRSRRPPSTPPAIPAGALAEPPWARRRSSIGRRP